MGKIMILNGSPRAPKSNSKRLADIFINHCHIEITYRNITKKNFNELRSEIEHYSDLLFIFPLYADSLPVGLLNFLKMLEKNPPTQKPVISVLINCGFLEYQQNQVAIKMIRYFCDKNGYSIGSILMMGSGEAILDTPFKYIANKAVRKLANSIVTKNYQTFHATMPISKRLFLFAANIYWTSYGKKYGITKKQMQSMKIE